MKVYQIDGIVVFDEEENEYPVAVQFIAAIDVGCAVGVYLDMFAEGAEVLEFTIKRLGDLNGAVID